MAANQCWQERRALKSLIWVKSFQAVHVMLVGEEVFKEQLIFVYQGISIALIVNIFESWPCLYSIRFAWWLLAKNERPPSPPVQVVLT